MASGIDVIGKKGLVDAKGNQLIPHLYEDLYEEQTYGFENDEFVALTSAIGRVNKDSDWTVFGTDYKVINTLKAGEFVGTLGEHILFQEGTQINAYQSITAVHDKEYFAKDPFTQIFKGTNKGAVDANGTLIIPPLYNRIKREVTNDRAFYFCSTLDGGFDIYDTLGKLVHTFKEGRYNGTVCQGLEGYYRINADYKEGMFWYNKDKGKFELLLDPKFQYISCNSLDPDLPLAKGSVREGETTNDYFIYWDGRMELIEK